MTNRFHLQKRRAISSIIGSFFFLTLMIGAFGAMLAAFQFQTDMVSTQRTVTDQEVKKAQERFTIDASHSGTGTGPYYLNVSIENTGTNDVEIVDLWYIAEGGSYGATPISVNLADSFVPAGQTIDVLASQSLSTRQIAAGTYTIKAVTAIGNMVTTELIVPSTGASAEDVIKDELIAKPAVYAAFPNPWIKGAALEGYFAVVIANPTNQAMTVNRVSVQLVSPNNPDYFSSGTPTAISPSTGTWTQQDEVVYWESTTGVSVSPYSTQVFSAKVLASSSVQFAPIVTVNTNAWTSFGQFGSSKIDTIGSNTQNYAIPNVYLSTSVSSSPDRVYAYSAVTGTKKYYVTVENTGPSGSKINSGSYLIINIPEKFSNITTVTAETELSTVQQLDFNDGSAQLKVTLPQIDVGASNARTYVFSADSPTVTATTLYVFHMYATGTTTAGSSTGLIGPVAEAVIQVCPSSGC